MNQTFPRRSSPYASGLVAVLTGVALLLAAAGCGTTSGSDPAGFASVTIQNHSLKEIATVTAQVFSGDGYNGGMTGPEQMVFEKFGSRASTISREGLVGAYYGARVIKRVKVDIVPLSGGAHRLQCKVYMVSGGDDPFFQDEVPLANLRSGQYQSLLNKIAKELK